MFASISKNDLYRMCDNLPEIIEKVIDRYW